MGLMKKFGDLVSPNDPELVQKTLARLSEQDRWNDVFSTKLIELLDKNDALKSELRQSALKATADLSAARDTLVLAERLVEDAKHQARRTIQAAIAVATLLAVATSWVLFFFLVGSTTLIWLPVVATFLIAILGTVFIRRMM